MAGPGRAIHSNTSPTGVEGTARDWRARLRCPWAVAGPGRASRRRVEPKARGAYGSRAGRRPRAHKAARPTRHATRCPERPRGHKQQQAGRPPPTGTHSGQAPPVWRAPEGPEGTGGLRGGAWLRCPWAVAGPGRASRRRAERSSWRGRLAGGPPPTGTQSSPAPQSTRGTRNTSGATSNERQTRGNPAPQMRDGVSPTQSGGEV